MIPDSIALILLAASILGSSIYYGNTKPVKEENK